MSHSADEELARELQQQEYQAQEQKSAAPAGQPRAASHHVIGCGNSFATSYAFDPDLHDPNPDVHALFGQYNRELFDGYSPVALPLDSNSLFDGRLLEGVEVKWSNRLTRCAGEAMLLFAHWHRAAIRARIDLSPHRPLQL